MEHSGSVCRTIVAYSRQYVRNQYMSTCKILFAANMKCIGTTQPGKTLPKMTENTDFDVKHQHNLLYTRLQSMIHLRKYQLFHFWHWRHGYTKCYKNSPHLVTYAPVKFDVPMSNGLGDGFTRTYIIGSLTLSSALMLH